MHESGIRNNNKRPAAIVTGGGGSIGRSVCARLAEQGYLVWVADLDKNKSESVARSIGSDHVGFGGDLTDENVVSTLVNQVTDQSRLSVLVNSMGISPKTPQGKVYIPDINMEGFRRVLDVNLIAPFLLMQQAYPHMPTDGFSSIVNIISIASRMATGGSKDATFPPLISSASHYGASKAALRNLTISFSRELATRRIRVNDVAPGFIDTDLTVGIPQKDRERVTEQIPLGRAGTPNDIANAVEFLTSEKSSYITGATIDVNGGWLPS